MHARRLCFAVFVTGIVVAACSSSAASPGGYTQDLSGDNLQPQVTAAAYGGAPVAGATEAPTVGAAVPAASGATSTGADAAPAPEDQIVKTGTITLQVVSLDDSMVQVSDQMHALNGWLAGSNRTSDNAQDEASLTFRIPVANFESALAAMRKMGVKVLGEHTESTSVGGQIVDLQARIANLKATEKALQAIMDRATTISDVLTVQQQLTQVQGEIEELTGQLAALTNQASYSTLTVVLVVPITATPSPSESPSPSPSATATPIPWSAGDQAGQAAGTLGDVAKGTATVLIWLLILVVPITVALIVLLALFGLLARIVDPYRRRLLPFTVAKPVDWSSSRIPLPAYGPYAGTTPAPGPASAPPSASGPQEPPKA
jgi:hypothetical protein